VPPNAATHVSNAVAGASKALPASRSGSTAIIIVGFVLAVVGLALTAHPPKRGRLTRFIAFGCYLAAAELLLSLVRHLPVFHRVVVGAVAAVFFLLWEWLSRREPVPTPVMASRPDVQPEASVSADHLNELKVLARAYKTTVGYWRTAQGTQNPNLEKSLWDHCPDAGKALEKVDAELPKQEASARTFRAWLQRQDRALWVAGNSILRAVENDSTALAWSVNSDYLWLDGGSGVAPVAPDTDVAALKRPYEELLARARESSEGKALRAASIKLFAAQADAQSELGHVILLKAIYGKCDLCRAPKQRA
jgi:hypothetical protein